jgi:hypothetical protein
VPGSGTPNRAGPQAGPTNPAHLTISSNDDLLLPDTCCILRILSRTLEYIWSVVQRCGQYINILNQRVRDRSVTDDDAGSNGVFWGVVALRWWRAKSKGDVHRPPRSKDAAVGVVPSISIKVPWRAACMAWLSSNLSRPNLPLISRIYGAAGRPPAARGNRRRTWRGSGYCAHESCMVYVSLSCIAGRISQLALIIYQTYDVLFPLPYSYAYIYYPSPRAKKYIAPLMHRWLSLLQNYMKSNYAVEKGELEMSHNIHVCLVACISCCLHRGMQWTDVWLLSTRLYACETCVWLPAYRCGVRLARYLKHPRPGSAGASKLFASLEPGSRRPGSCSRATGRSQPNRRYMYSYKS